VVDTGWSTAYTCFRQESMDIFLLPFPAIIAKCPRLDQVTQFRKWFPGMDRFANASMAEKLKDRQGMISAGKQVVT